jgi:glycosyltransferase involved in cell wall biosynthesis
VRLLVHDYGGYAFAVQLSRELAGRGHEVLHVHCPSYASGKGSLTRQPEDPVTFDVQEIPLGSAFAKHHPLRRLWQEWRYGRSAARRVAGFRPDVVLSANAPLLSQWLILRSARRARAGFVFWQQDVISEAIVRFSVKRLPRPLRFLARPFQMLEGFLLRRSDVVVPISEDFEAILDRFGVPRERIQVVHNWAPVAELPPRPRDNDFARRHGLVGKIVLLYAGTIGLKHDPGLILALAHRFRGDDRVSVVVVSEGAAAEQIAVRSNAEGLGVLVLPYQPYSVFPDVLGAADVLVAILEPDAGTYSVPSKILSYHCADRPLLAAMPEANLAARLIRSVGSGIVVDPGEPDALADAAERLAFDGALRAELGGRARAYAEGAFDIGSVGTRFETIIERAGSGPGYSRGTGDVGDSLSGDRALGG